MCHMWNFHYRGKSNSHTCMQHHPHDKDEWEEIWSAEVGQSLSCPTTSCFPTPPTHTWMCTQFLTVKNCKYFSQSAQRLHSQRVTSENLGHLVSNPAPILWDKFWHIQQKHAHKQPNMSTRQWIQIGLNPPPTTTTWVHAIRGPADPLQPWQLYILRFYDLDLICECHRVAWKGSA